MVFAINNKIRKNIEMESRQNGGAFYEGPYFQRDSPFAYLNQIIFFHKKQIHCLRIFLKFEIYLPQLRQ